MGAIAASTLRDSAALVRSRIASDPLQVYSSILGCTAADFVKQSATERAIKCRLHDDHKPSLRVNIEKGVWKCDPCGKGGDAFTLYAELHGLNVRTDFSAIVEALTASLGLASTVPPIVLNGGAQNGTSHHQNGNGHPLTLEQFARAKGLDPQFLSDMGVCEEKGGLTFRYSLMDGQRAARQRIRLSLNGDKRFIWSSAEGRPVPYGLSFLKEARKRGVTDLVLEEGETDWLTLKRHNITAIGIPGANICSILQAPHIAGFSRILIVRENDHGGETFEKGCVGRLAELEFDGVVAVIEMAKAGIKDPNELHLKLLNELDAFASEWGALALMARVVELPRTGVIMSPLDAVTATRVDWLWRDRLPLGNTSMLAGLPGAGKSTLTLDIAARVSRGAAFPDGAQGFGPAKVLIVTGEDNVSSTIVPRLTCLNADLKRISVLKTVAAVTQDGEIGQHAFNLSTDLPALDKTLTRDTSIKLVIIDPLSSFLGRTDAHKEAEIRGLVMTPLFALAETHNIAVLIVVHLNKGSGSPLQRISGSVAIAGAPRMVWAAVADPQQPDRNLFLPVKYNLTKNIGGLAYNIMSSPRDPEVGTVTWHSGAVFDRVEDIFAEEAENRATGGAAKLQAARDFWIEALKDGQEHLSDELEQMGRARGLRDATLRRAKIDLGIKSKKKGYQGLWWVSLPGEISPR